MHLGRWATMAGVYAQKAREEIHATPPAEGLDVVARWLQRGQRDWKSCRRGIASDGEYARILLRPMKSAEMGCRGL